MADLLCSIRGFGSRLGGAVTSEWQGKDQAYRGKPGVSICRISRYLGCNIVHGTGRRNPLHGSGREVVAWCQYTKIKSRS